MAEQALHGAEKAARALRSEAGAAGDAAATPFELPNVKGHGNGASRMDAGGDPAGAGIPGAGAGAGLALLNDVALKVKIELGRTHMYIEDVLRLSPESVIELDKAAGDPVDIFVNDRLVARGEVLVLNENFCVRVSEIIDQAAEDD
jgi:flagellar motor switch protein FliN